MNDAVEVKFPNQPSRWVVTVDHATNRVPVWVNDQGLGVPAKDMERHIAFDPGAAALALEMAQILDASLIQSRFSRLVIDPNRGEDDPTLVMQVYDGTIIPGNRNLSLDERTQRLERLYRPYHGAITETLRDIAAPLVVAIHTFTPQLSGRPKRPWGYAILSATDRRLADPLLDILRQDGTVVGDNEPYTGALRGDSMDRHGVQTDTAHVLIEVRNDLLRTHADVSRHANVLSSALLRASALAKL